MWRQNTNGLVNVSSVLVLIFHSFILLIKLFYLISTSFTSFYNTLFTLVATMDCVNNYMIFPWEDLMLNALTF